MYASHFGLRQEAFSIAPDPRFLHLGTGHREALAHLLYGLQGGGGFVLLTGEIGAGKTTVCRLFLEQVPAGHRVAYLYNPRLTAHELMQSIGREFGIPPAGGDTVKPLVDALEQFLLQCHARGESCVLVVDEAQALDADLLEMLRLLTNLETPERKLLQIVLIGQPELRDKLARPELEQLSQRIIARVHLGPLSAAETAAYVQHRLQVAGLQGPLPLDRRALARVHRLSGGVPRRINLLCQRALLGAYALGTHRVDARIVRQAAREAFGDQPAARRHRLAWAGGAAAGLALLVVAWGWWAQGPGSTGPATAGPAVAASGAGATRPPAADAATRAEAATAPGAAASDAAPGSAPATAFDDDRQAWQAMAGAWELPADARPAGCRAAREWQLACHEGQGSWELLRRLDRPVLLELRAGGSTLLLALDGRAARVAGAQGEQRVERTQLESAWTGRYATWWRPPPGWAAAGDRLDGAASAWALERLVALQGESRADARRTPRDELLRQRVFAFQVAQGLDLDGVAGPLTLMQLNRASGVAEPRLRPTV